MLRELGKWWENWEEKIITVFLFITYIYLLAFAVLFLIILFGKAL